MSVKIIDTLKPKNNGSFPIVEAVDVAVSADLRLPEALEAKADVSALAETQASVELKADASSVETATANLQGQINQIEISATAEAVVAPEVVAARVGDDGTTYTTLKERLDTEFDAVSSSISGVEGEISGLFEEKTEFDWVKGYINDTGSYSTSQQFSNYTTRYPYDKGAKFISIAIGDDRQVSVAKYSKTTGQFVEKTSWITENFSLDADYDYVFNIATISGAGSTVLTPEQVLSKISIRISYQQIDTSEFAKLEEGLTDAIFVLGNQALPTPGTTSVTVEGTAIFLAEEYTLTAKPGYLIGVYNNLKQLLTGGWVDEFQIEADGNYWVVIKQTDSSDMSDVYQTLDIRDILDEEDYSPFMHPVDKIVDDVYIESDQIIGLNSILSSYSKTEVGNRGCKFVLGNKSPGVHSEDTRVVTVEGIMIKIPANYALTTKQGYYVGVYSSAGALISDGWTDEYTTESEGYYWIVFKKTNSSDMSSVYKDLKITDVLDSEDYSPFIFEYKKIESDVFIDADQIVGASSESVAKSKWTDKNVAFIGDSITYGVGTTKTYIQYLDGMIGFADVYVDGIPGSSFSSTATDSYTPIVERTGEIPDDRDLIVIFAGTNDFGHSTPLGTIADSTDVSFYGAVAKTIVDILTLYPGVRLVLLTQLHRSAVTYIGEDTENNVGKVLKDYVDALKAVCEKYSVPIIDTYAMYGLNPAISSISTAYMPDGLHPNAGGHKLLAERIAPYLELM